MVPDGRMGMIEQKGSIRFVFTFDEGNDGMGKVKKAFDALGKKSDQVVFVTNPCNVITKRQQNLSFLFQ
jgi:hypothetical protein